MATALTMSSSDLTDNVMNIVIPRKEEAGVNEYGFKVYLYAANHFSTWWDAVSSPDEDEKLYHEAYSEYIMAFDCEVSTIDSNAFAAFSGCCIKDETQEGGGYCMMVNSSTNGMNTYFLTDANFDTVLSSYDFSTMTAVTDDYPGITTFKTEQVAGAWGHVYGFKLQPWPAAAYSESYRFVKGQDVTGYIYDPNGTSSAKWIDEEVTLTKGASELVASAAVILSYLAFASF